MALEGGVNRTVAVAAGFGQPAQIRLALCVATVEHAPMGSPFVERLRVSSVTVSAADVSLIVHGVPEVLEVRADDLATSRELRIAPARTGREQGFRKSLAYGISIEVNTYYNIFIIYDQWGSQV